MKPNHRQLRRYGTKYTARVTSTTSNGRSLSVEILPPTNPIDTRGYPLPRHHLICQITQHLKQSPTIPDHLPDIQTLTRPETTLILKSLSTSPSLSLHFFTLCKTQLPDFKPDCFVYNRVLLTLSNGGPHWMDRVRELTAEMERDGVKGNISTVNILIGVLGAEGVEMCLGLVKKWDLKLNSYTYKCILQAYLRSYDVVNAYRVYEVDQAYRVFEDMKRKHCEPDEYTYTIMVRMTGKNGKPLESLALFQEMLAKGLTPNLIAYNTMIEAFAKSRMVEKAIYLFSKMIENNCRPNEFTYSLILTVLVAEGQLGKLDEVIEMSKKYVTKSIYAYLIRMLSKLGHASEAHRLFCNMWTFHDKGDRDACIAILESLCNTGKTAEAIDLLDKLHEKGINTDIMMYNTVLSALGRFKQIFHLQDVYEKMRKDGPSPDIYSYNILISSFGRAGKVDEAVKIFEQLEESDCEPDVVSYNSLINCLGKNGNLDEAHMRFKEMQEKGLNPDVVTYSTLIECFGKTDKVDMACSLFDDMVAQGCCPNIVTYNILLDCLERSGKTGEAVDMYSKLKQQGLTPDSITYAILERLQSGSYRSGRIRKQHPITGWVVSPLR